MIAHYRALGYQLCFHRLRTPLAEVDLLLENEDERLMIEVKYLDSWDRSHDRISFKQKQRLKNAFHWLLPQSSKPLILRFVFVAKSGQIWSTEGVDFL